MNRPLHRAYAIALAALAACRGGSGAPDAGPAPAAEAGAPAPPSTAAAPVALPTASPDAAAPDAAAPDAAAPDAASPDAASPDAAAPDAAAPDAAVAAPDAGCKLLRGPLALSLRGPALLWTPDNAARADFRVIFNRDGVAHHVAPAFTGLPGASAPRETAAPDAGAGDTAAARASWPACSIAARFTFCMDHGGTIRRTPMSGEAPALVGAGRRGTGISAVPLPGGRTLLAFLSDRITTEGAVTQAFAVLDDRPAVPLSTEGSGATFVALAPWKGKVLAMYIDARSALTPVHARTLGLTAEGKLELGPDAVIFVGDAGESRMGGALAVGADGPAFALLPASKDMAAFGMAAIRIDDAPRDDMPAVWSLYPNGLSPAPIAATQGTSPIHVARVRPSAREPGARHVLELGQLDGEGRFQPRCQAAQAGSFKHVAIEADRDGSLWIVYTTASGTFVEQRAARP
ncbi:uncharacterized protein SOCE26_091760 [Sorangium cellulosum]|uniref:Secreted protein n=1 Tax=Sorangium cellulosum TaxID=56 RepID=A0A2L0F7S6_SORCE|nr:hypothetical protein [Sorangium cellulosum]AUX47654.1 uncharacterized protein SOCE26_091760 [Sorangium cellulosum]